MTIGIGILATDGIVLASDTEEGDGYFKRSESKITGGTSYEIVGSYAPGKVLERDVALARPAHESGSHAIVGAGDSANIKELSRLFTPVCFDNVDSKDEDVRAAFKKVLTPYYTETILPFQNLPPQDRPEVSLLIALCGKKTEPRLFVTERLTVNRYAQYAAVGAARLHAESILKTLYPRGGRRDVQSAARLAAYVVWKAKDAIPGVGGRFTQMWILHNRTSYHVAWQAIRDMEMVFDQHERIEGLAVELALAADTTNADLLKKFTRSFAEFRRDFDKVALNFPPPEGRLVPRRSTRGRKSRPPSRA